MARPPNKYGPGLSFLGVAGAAEWMRHGHYIWWRGKPYHPSFISSWPFRVVANEVQSGELRHAIITRAWLDYALARQFAELANQKAPPP